MNTTSFASELGTDARTARKFLRSITPKDEQPGKGSRWELPDTKKELNSLRKKFTAWKTAQEVKAAEKAAEAEVADSDEEVTDEV